MKVVVTLVIELDAGAWNEYQGLSAPGRTAGAAVIRDDVKFHVLNMVQQSMLLDEADATVELR